MPENFPESQFLRKAGKNKWTNALVSEQLISPWKNGSIFLNHSALGLDAWFLVEVSNKDKIGSGVFCGI